MGKTGVAMVRFGLPCVESAYLGIELIPVKIAWGALPANSSLEGSDSIERRDGFARVPTSKAVSM